MFCLFSVRQIKPGTYDEFRKAWEPERFPDQLVKAYIMRNQDNPDEVLSFGFFDASFEEIEALRDDPEFTRMEIDRLQRISEYEVELKVNSVYELTEEIELPGR